MSANLAVVIPAYNEPGIGETLQALYDQRLNQGVHHYVVDNGSAFGTREAVHDFTREHPDFPLTIIEEEQKGTGAAADTGFRESVEPIIARTDADSRPARNWTTRIIVDFARQRELELLGGKSTPVHDEHYRKGDDLLMPFAVRSARVVLAMEHLNPRYLKAVVGHNMATRRKAYERVGGFDRTAIDRYDEDIEYSLKIAREFGSRAITIDSGLQVATSMRRIRSYGVAGTALHHLLPSLRTKLRSEIDVR